MNVFDASALLAFLQGEHGSDMVESELEAGGVCGAANWSETVQTILAHDRDWDLAAGLLRSYGLEVAPVTEGDAEWAGRRWRQGDGLSLGDRLCMALGERLDAKVWTADSHWGDEGRIHQIRT
ncbi:MAG: PIN domain-containing protein [Acidimicrobiia bacterium]